MDEFDPGSQGFEGFRVLSIYQRGQHSDYEARNQNRKPLIELTEAQAYAIAVLSSRREPARVTDERIKKMGAACVEDLTDGQAERLCGRTIIAGRSMPEIW